MMDKLDLFHDTRDFKYRNPFGAVASGNCVSLCLLAVESYEFKGALDVTVHFEAETSSGNLFFDVPMKKESVLKNGRLENWFRAAVECFDSPGVYFYYFVITQRASLQFDARVQQVFYGNNRSASGGLGSLYEGDPVPFQITVYEKGLSVPRDFYSSVVYQIFPDRFYRSGLVNLSVCGRVNGEIRIYQDWYEPPYYEKDCQGNIITWDFYGGDLYGITEKLDYIISTGADKIYLNPIFEAASNHRYDTADYLKVDPILGGEEALDALLEACRSRKIGVILDGVFSHTGCDSRYFDRYGNYGGSGAYGNPDSPYRSWYRFKGGDDEEYECWWNCKALPNVNEMEPSYLNFIVYGEGSVLKKWLDKGVCGFRLDVADELPDAFISAVRKKLKEYKKPERMLIGEVWEDASNKVSYSVRRQYFTGEELHGVTNYLFRDYLIRYLTGKITAQELWARLLSIQENYPAHNYYCLWNMTGSHDVKRLFSILKEHCRGEESFALQLHMAYAAVLFSYPGIPVVYYGDEICMEGDTDPDNRRTYPWNRIGHPEVLELFRMLGLQRRRQPVLQTGMLRVITPVNEDGSIQEDIFAFERHCHNGQDAFGEPLIPDWEQGESDCIVCAVNRSRSQKEVMLSGFIPGFMYVSYKYGTLYRVDAEGFLHVPVGDILLLKRCRG